MSGTRRNALALAVAAAGLLMLVVGAWALAQLRVSLAHGPMLREPFGLAVDPEGALLVGVEAARIHVYARDGRFLQHFAVPSDGARFRLRAPEAGRVQVATADGRWLELDFSGDLVTERPDPDAFERFGSDGDVEAAGPSGERYALRTGALWRVDPPPERMVAPGLRWPLAWFTDRLPAIAVVLCAGVTLMIGGVAATSRSRAKRG